MAFALADRVKETTTTTGTGTITLLGAVTTYQSFYDGIGDGETTRICIVHQNVDEWEVCESTYTYSGTTVSRGTLVSSSTGSRVDFSAGTKDVFIVHSANETLTRDDDGRWPIKDPDSTDILYVSHDGDNCLFETLSGSFKFVPDSTVSNETGVIDISGSGTGYGKLRVNDQDDLEYCEIYCSSGNVFIEGKGISPSRMYLQYGASGDIRAFYGSAAGENRNFTMYGYKTGVGTKTLAFQVGASGTAFVTAAAGEDLHFRAGAGSGGNVIIDDVLKLPERSSDPDEPAEGETIIWTSDGTEKGDDGDVICASKAGGSTTYTIIHDHSAGTAW